MLAKFRYASTFSPVAGVVAGSCTDHQTEPQGIGAELIDDLDGIYPLPRDLLIFRPWESRTSPWIRTVRKGTSPINSNPITIILATQK